MFGDVAFSQAPFAALGGNTFPVAIAEGASVSSTVNTDVARGGLIFEGASATDSLVGKSEAVGVMYEASVASDLFYSSGNIYRATVSETLDASTTVSFNPGQLYARVNEEAAVVVAPSAVSTVYTAIVESATGADTSNRGAGLFADIAEAATGADTVTRTADYSALVQEQATGNDNLSAFTIIVVTPSGVQLYIAVGNPLVWGVIDDAQDPNWTPIQT